MEDVAHHALHAIASHLRLVWGQPASCPDNHIVGKRAQQHHHLLRFKALLAALGQPQPLLVVLEARLDAAAAVVVEAYVGQQHLGVVEDRLGRLPRLHHHLLRQQRGEYDGVLPLTVLLLPPHRDTAEWTDVHRRRCGNPPHLPAGDLRVVTPLRDTCAQLASALARVVLGVEVIAARKRPVDVVDTAATRVDPQDGGCRFVSSNSNTCSVASTSGCSAVVRPVVPAKTCSVTISP
jgi:hypothetical protein